MDYATDEERVEELKKWWKENGKSVIFGIALGASILIGWRYWQDYQLNQSVQASTLYTQLEQSIQQKKPEQATAFSNEIFKQYGKHIYSVYAAMSMAKMKMDEKQPEAAIAFLKQGLDDSPSSELSHILTLRLARVYLATSELDKALALVGKVENSPFSAAYEEIKGDILARQGKAQLALAAYQKAVQDKPAGTQTNPSLQYKIDDLAKVQ